MSDPLDQLRQEITAVDRNLIELLEKRFRLAAEVGRHKAEKNRAVRVSEVEQRVLKRAREGAERCGVSPEMMEKIFSAVMHGSVERQHRVGVEMRARDRAPVLILGGAGAMGRWLARFLENIGHGCEGVDPIWSASAPMRGRYANLDAVPDLNAYAALFVSVSLEKTPALLKDLAGRGLAIPVFEISSMKDHLGEALADLAKAGVPTVSLHPMFGPGKNLYETITLVHAAGEDPAGERARALQLLDHPYLELVSLPFASHDRFMGWLLGLAHLSGMLFASALQRSGLDPEEIGKIASTTFSRQVSTARSVLDEDTDLYFDIQHLNPFRGEVYEALAGALSALTQAVAKGDRQTFAELLTGAAAALPDLADA